MTQREGDCGAVFLDWRPHTARLECGLTAERAVLLVHAVLARLECSLTAERAVLLVHAVLARLECMLYQHA